LGKVIHGNGVTPDIVVEDGRIDLVKAPEKAEVSENIFEEIKGAQMPSKEQKPFDYKSDNQIMRAADILKAFKFYK